MSIIAIQKTLDKGKKVQATFINIGTDAEKTKPRGFTQEKKNGLAKYQDDEK